MDKNEIIYRYGESFKAMKHAETVFNFLSCVLVLLLILVPLFKGYFTIDISKELDLEKYESLEEYMNAANSLQKKYNLTDEQILKGGKIQVEKKYSYFDQFVSTIKHVIFRETSDFDLSILDGTWTVITTISAIITLFSCISILYSNIRDKSNFSLMCLNEYDKIKKRDAMGKKTWFRANWLYATFIYVLIDVVFYRFIFSSFYASINITALIIIIISLLIVSYFYLKYKKINRAISDKIVSEEYN